MKAAFAAFRLPSSLVALVFLLALPGLTQAQAAVAPDCYVLSVGIDQYAGDKKLIGCLNDARNITSAFAGQKGTMFGKVMTRTLLDGQATRASIVQNLNSFTRMGKPGDFFVFFLSGHGSRFNDTRQWYFLPIDFTPRNAQAAALTDKQILSVADALARQGKKVVIIIDACFCGQVAVAAQGYLNRYRDPNGGALILMLSSGPEQESTLLGNSSAFARSVVEAINGSANFKLDGKITLDDIRAYTFNRTHDLMQKSKTTLRQDSIVSWSPGLSANMTFAALKYIQPTSAPQFAIWIGNETLPGYGGLSFHMYPGGKAYIIDAKESMEGTWEQNGKQISLKFSNGQVSYTGTVNEATLVGTAENLKASWSFSVRLQQPSSGK